MWLIQHAEEDSLQNQNVRVFDPHGLREHCGIRSVVPPLLCVLVLFFGVQQQQKREHLYEYSSMGTRITSPPPLPEGCFMNVSEGYISCLCLQLALKKPNYYQIIQGCYCWILNASHAAERVCCVSDTYLCIISRQKIGTLATFKIYVGLEVQNTM